MNKNTLTTDLANSSIYLDFEGEGKKKDGTIPKPHLAGIYLPSSLDRSRKYTVSFFRENWTAPKNGHHHIGQVITFEDFIESIINEVIESKSLIIYWSIHERTMVAHFAPDLLKLFDENSLNLLPPLKKLKRQRKLVLDPKIEKELNKYLNVLKPKRKLVSEIKPSVPQICRNVDKEAERVRKWKNWDPKIKIQLQQLIDYNKEDCLTTRALAIYYANYLLAKK